MKTYNEIKQDVYNYLIDFKSLKESDNISIDEDINQMIENIDEISYMYLTNLIKTAINEGKYINNFKEKYIPDSFYTLDININDKLFTEIENLYFYIMNLDKNDELYNDKIFDKKNEILKKGLSYFGIYVNFLKKEELNTLHDNILKIEKDLDEKNHELYKLYLETKKQYYVELAKFGSNDLLFNIPKVISLPSYIKKEYDLEIENLDSKIKIL